MADMREAWERFYARSGQTWKGSPLPLPRLRKGARVLDVGCGPGSTLIQIAAEGYIPVGLDISGTALEIARGRLERRGIPAELVMGDILSPGLLKGRFDAVLLHHVLSSLLKVERERAVAVCRDLLSRGGLLSFQDISVSDMRYGHGIQVEEGTFLKGNGLRDHFFTLEETGALFGDLVKVELGEFKWGQRTPEGMMRRARVKGLFKLP